MIGIFKEKIGTIPVLTVLDTKYENKPLPVVTYFHGFTSAKEHNLPLAYLLAEKGFRVLLPDCDLHGEREQDVTREQKLLAFWNIILKNIQELETIKEYLDQNGLILNDQFGIAGTSMGGITTAAALTKYPWIKAAAILMGSPKLTEFAELAVNEFKKAYKLPVTDEELNALYRELEQFDLSRKPETLNDRPLLFWHGENDSVVPYQHAASFYEETADLYKNKKHIQMISEPNRDHKVSREAILKTAEWFDTYLIR